MHYLSYCILKIFKFQSEVLNIFMEGLLVLVECSSLQTCSKADILKCSGNLGLANAAEFMIKCTKPK